MLAHLLAIAVACGSLSFYLALFLVPRVYRQQSDFVGSGLGLFYALVLWICAGRITGGVLLGQTASVVLLGWLGWQTTQLRRTTNEPVPTPQLPNIVQKLLQPLRQRLGNTPKSTPVESAPAASDPGKKSEEIAQTTAPVSSPASANPDPSTPSTSIATKSVEPPTSSPLVDNSDEKSDCEVVVELTDLATDTPELATATESADSPEAASVSGASRSAPPEATPTETVVTPTAGSGDTTQSSETPETENSPPPPRPIAPIQEQDLSDVPEPDVIQGLQDLEDLDIPEPAEAQSTSDSSDSLETELWDTDLSSSASPQPEVAPAKEAIQAEPKSPDVIAQDSTAKTPTPKTPTPKTIEAEVSTSFADRLVEADFNPDDEDIVDATVISSSPADGSES
ncbi:MAG: Ycf66 family protein [Spirulinaceae cyanobacterium]